MSDTVQILAVIAVTAAVTGLVRAVPFLLFGGKRGVPELVRYLGDVLPPAIMVILVLYCLRGMDFTGFPYGLAELLSVAVVILLQMWKKNTILSIVMGTVLYMVLIRTIFPV